jgi:3-oxoacyl-[acyl-carrier-protein] synthase II
VRAGAVETAFCVQSLVTNKVAPTINLDNPSPECDLDYVPHTAREKEINHVMNNSFGFWRNKTVVWFYQNSKK